MNFNSMPGPALALITHKNRSHRLDIKNFTLGGLMVETSDEEITDLPLGTVLEVELITNHGERISGMPAMIRHISLELVTAQITKVSWGLKFMPMKLETDGRYRDLIAAHCRVLRDMV